MPSRWIDFIKSWATEHKITYGCALSDVDMRAAYHKKYPKTTLTKADKQTLKPLESEIKRFASLDQKNKKKVDDESHKFAELYGKVDKLYDEQQALTKKNGFVGAMATRVMGLRSSLNLIGTKFDYFDGEEPEPAPAAAAPAPAPAAAKASSPPKAKAKTPPPAKELTLTDRTSALPADLQGLIFSKLPQQKQRDALEGTEEEKRILPLKKWLKTHPVKGTKAWIKDYRDAYGDDGYNRERERLYEQLYDEVGDENGDPRFQNSHRWSEKKGDKMEKLGYEIAELKLQDEIIGSIKESRARGLSDFQMFNQLQADEPIQGTTYETAAEKKARLAAYETPEEKKEKEEREKRWRAEDEKLWQIERERAKREKKKEMEKQLEKLKQDALELERAISKA